MLSQTTGERYNWSDKLLLKIENQSGRLSVSGRPLVGCGVVGTLKCKHHCPSTQDGCIVSYVVIFKTMATPVIWQHVDLARHQRVETHGGYGGGRGSCQPAQINRKYKLTFFQHGEPQCNCIIQLPTKVRLFQRIVYFCCFVQPLSGLLNSLTDSNRRPS